MAKILPNEKLESVLNSIGKAGQFLWRSSISDQFPDKILDLNKNSRNLFSRKLTDGKDGVFFLSDDKEILIVSRSWASVLENSITNVVNVYQKHEGAWIDFSVYYFPSNNPDEKRLLAYNSSKVRNILKRLASNDSEKDSPESRLKNIHNILYKESELNSSEIKLHKTRFF